MAQDKNIKTDLPSIRKQITLIQLQRQQLELKLIRVRSSMEKGSVVRVYKPCTKNECIRCATGRKHGPYLYLNVQIGGRPTQRYVGKKSDTPIVKRARTYMSYQDTLAQVRKITKQMDSLFNLYRDQLTIPPTATSHPKPKTNDKNRVE